MVVFIRRKPTNQKHPKEETHRADPGRVLMQTGIVLRNSLYSQNHCGPSTVHRLLTKFIQALVFRSFMKASLMS